LNYLTAEVKRNLFYNCNGEQGGGIYVNEIALTLENNNFTSNIASNFNGAGVYIVCNPSGVDKPCTSTFTDNTFASNDANWGGGGVYWLGEEPTYLTTNNTFDGNYAVYGANYASNASAIIQITSDAYDTQHPTSNTSRLLATDSLTSIASG